MGDKLQQPKSSVKLKTKECSIFGLEFDVGQALGGHMRRHSRRKQFEDSVPKGASYGGLYFVIFEPLFIFICLYLQ